ncbi:MAG: aminotransferase class IV [Caloramator sp.]|nr:aminotransferase class IV [Caloramator sp.]
MAEAILKFFMHNGNLYETNYFENIYCEINPAVYEVIRLIDGKPLFLEEHFERLKNSTKLLNKELNINMETLRQQILELANINQVKDLNIKIVINEFETPNVYLYFIKSEYPTCDMYKNGVKTIIYRAVRDNPNAKVIYKNLREDINRKLRETGCYEALLLNEKDEITEGSRSNIFFIRENKVYTAPAKDVLLGITRQKIIKICRLNAIEMIEEPIKIENLKHFDAAFITGTSPKVLPISEINDIIYDVNNELMRKIMQLYDDEIKNYLGTVH